MFVVIAMNYRDALPLMTTFGHELQQIFCAPWVVDSMKSVSKC